MVRVSQNKNYFFKSASQFFSMSSVMNFDPKYHGVVASAAERKQYAR